ncbi:DUF817 domain-containing protein [Kordiimonas gwangyangensis]|uniref:DUF817 domain-containing protein n=1 Tax=Kordiimonas gwangyangensis TaxID=288022 RepID=UPI000368BEF2|nr:DUF817 domain-containing protein [Kordiimonas gwangyangensis]
MRAHLSDLWWFGIKQAWACLFGAVLLALILCSYFFWPADALIARYDFLFLSALLVQVIMLAFRLETWDEAKVIFIFHVVGTVMEIFKTHMGSWVYPEENFFRIGGVPLFSGFMYASVGSYFARVWRLFDFRFSNYPPAWSPFGLAAAIYVNFFTHHYFWDVRGLLFAATVLMYARCRIYFTPNGRRHSMPILLALFLGAGFIWLAENIATFGKIWLYPNQHEGWQLVSFSKLGSWFLLMIISGALVSIIQKPQAEPKGP